MLIDILGFKNLICKETPDTIRNILDVPKNILKQDNYKKMQKPITFFSDSVVISFDININHEIYKTLTLIQMIIIKWINLGVLSRGAVVVGDIVHNSNYIFGSGFVEAYCLERDAYYPRIVVDDEILNLCECYPIENLPGETERKFVESILAKDKVDDKKYIDYFSSYLYEVGNYMIINNVYYDKLYSIIKKILIVVMIGKYMKNICG